MAPSLPPRLDVLEAGHFARIRVELNERLLSYRELALADLGICLGVLTMASAVARVYNKVWGETASGVQGQTPGEGSNFLKLTTI